MPSAMDRIHRAGDLPSERSGECVDTIDLLHRLLKNAEGAFRGVFSTMLSFTSDPRCAAHSMPTVAADGRPGQERLGATSRSPEQMMHGIARAQTALLPDRLGNGPVGAVRGGVDGRTQRR
jgi:hypothetical protein